MSDANLRRNIRKPRFIDPRDMRVCSYRETDDLFILHIYLNQRQIHSGVYRHKRAPHSKLTTDAQRTWTKRLLDSLNLVVGQSVAIAHAGTRNRFLILTRRDEEAFDIDFQGLPDEAAAHDELVLEFSKQVGQRREVSVQLIDAHDKALTLELEAWVAAAEAELEDAAKELENLERWERLTWLLRRALLATRIFFEKGNEDCSRATFDIAPAERFYDTRIWVQWQWLADDEIQLEAIGPNSAAPRLVDGAVEEMERLGWLSPDVGHEPEAGVFTMRVRDPDLVQLAVILAKTLRRGYLAKSTDYVVLHPLDLADVVIDLPRESDHQKSCYPQGLMYPADVELLWNKFKR